jgi:hypothetical protein
VRERLKDVLRQYERRERHFEAVVRSKELEVLLARARVEEQKGCVEVARRVARAAEQQVSDVGLGLAWECVVDDVGSRMEHCRESWRRCSGRKPRSLERYNSVLKL